jgi:hypothetical protein
LALGPKQQTFLYFFFNHSMEALFQVYSKPVVAADSYLMLGRVAPLPPPPKLRLSDNEYNGTPSSVKD